jgi:hypothetical protein
MKAAPRVSGADGSRAVALASRILASVAAHSWDGRRDEAIGPAQIPSPLGPLFQPEPQRKAA